MLAFLMTRLPINRLAMAVFMAAQALGFVVFARASEPLTAAEPAPVPAAPNPRVEVQRALREFDRFLDHHPLLEEQLRLDSTLTGGRSFLERNPELRDFLRANPKVTEGLTVYPRYFLNRALLRQASAPLSFAELAPFKELFSGHPELERQLLKNPEQIRDSAFLDSHAALQECLVLHPALARVFLSPAPSPDRD